MDFLLDGTRHSLDREAVHRRLRDVVPEEVRTHWVDVDGVRWPPKQAFALATGLDRASFTSHIALRQLARLGFPTSSWSSGSARQRVDPVPDPTAEARTGTAAVGARADIVLVGCSAMKAGTARPAGELFTGAAFVKASALARRSGLPWYVVSAKHRLLAPDDVVAPYDMHLGKQSRQYREAWGEQVVTQLAARHDLAGAVVEIHAGSVYAQPLVRPLAAAGATLVEPLAGMGLGERLAWYGRRPAETPSAVGTVADVSFLLDEHNAMPPADFLSGGRAAHDRPGLYSWWAHVAGAHALTAGLGHRVAAGLVYAGRAGGQRPSGTPSTNTLWGRVGGMHLQGNRTFSTFRLTLTAALRDSGHSVADEAALSRWMHEHLRVAVLPLPAADVFSAEERLLELADPPLNLQGMPRTELRRTLSRLRSGLGSGDA